MKQGIPKWIFLIHVENAGNANFDVAFCCINVFNIPIVK